MRERGSALLTSVIAIMVLLMISGVLFTFVNYQFKLETSEEKGLKAFYLAEAGINYGVAMVRKNPTSYFGNVFYLEKQELILDKPFGIQGNQDKGVFDVYLQVNPSEQNYTFTLTSTGYYPDKQGIKRTLEEQYTFPKPAQP